MNNNVSQFRWILIFSLLVIATVISSCGSDDDDVVTIPRISDAGTVLAIEDLTAFGFKKSKTYDVKA